MRISGDESNLFECGYCGNIGLGQGETVCCGESMDPVESADTVVPEPTLEQVLRSVFGVSETELDVCIHVMEAGTVTVSELADSIDYDRSVVSRHLNHLTELGVLEKRRRILEQGGQVYVYTPVERDRIQRSFKLGFVEWFRQGVVLLDDLSREKIERIVETESTDGEWRIFDER